MTIGIATTIGHILALFCAYRGVVCRVVNSRITFPPF
jgi:hypothetical protein